MKYHRLIANAFMCGLLVAPQVARAQTRKGGGATAQIPEHPFPQPTGPYAVGMHEYLWIDNNRPETFTKDTSDRRHILVRVWYPAEAVPGAEKALYVTDVNEFPEGSHYRLARNVRTNAVMDAPVAKAKAHYPVLIYQPGGGTSRLAGTSDAEQFASHGYVVVGADHAGFSETVRFPDGYRFKADTLQAVPAMTAEGALEFWDYLGNTVLPTWTADGRYTLDKVAELDHKAGQLFYNKLDLSRIGMYGWSFGGATSMTMSKDDPRVKAAVDFDGQLFGDVRDLGTHRPVMMFNHGDPDKPPRPQDSAAMVKLVGLVDQWQQSFLAHSTNDWYDVTIARTKHGNFSDFVLFGPPAPSTPNQLDLDPRRGHEIITAYTLAFFNKYLLGQDSALLNGPSAKFPEVTFKKR